MSEGRSAALKITRKTYTTRRDKVVDFAVGFLGWFLLTGILGGGLARITLRILFLR